MQGAHWVFLPRHSDCVDRCRGTGGGKSTNAFGHTWFFCQLNEQFSGMCALVTK